MINIMLLVNYYLFARSIHKLKVVSLYLDQESLCTLQELVVYHEQRFVIGYDDEWFAKEICVELCDTIHDLCSNMLTVCVWVSSMQTRRVCCPVEGMHPKLSVRHQLPGQFPSVDCSAADMIRCRYISSDRYRYAGDLRATRMGRHS